MLKLSSAIFRQLLSWPIILCAALWLTLAYNLSFDEHLGAASLGAFLSYSVLALSALIVRFGYVLQQRRQQGWLRQDLLRRTTALAAVSESLAAVFSLFIFIVCSQLVVLGLNPPLNEQHEAHHLVMSRVASDSSWTFTWDDNIPEGSKLCLTFDFENSPDNVKTSSISNSIVEETVTPGNVFYWPLTVDDVRNKTITLESPLEHNLSLIRPLARLVITRPPISALPQLLLNQLLFFFTVIGLCLFIFRRLKVNGNLSSLGALAIASLTNLREVQLMPNVGALVSSGLRYERTALTTNDIALFTWLGIGLALIYFSCKAPRADKK
jgi:amino acid transporter